MMRIMKPPDYWTIYIGEDPIADIDPSELKNRIDEFLRIACGTENEPQSQTDPEVWDLY